MWFIYVSLCLGVVIGAKNIFPKKIVKYNDYLTQIGLFLLLFVMGISIGIKKDMINKLSSLGLYGFLYAFFTVIFSIVVVYILSVFVFRGKKQ